MVKNIITIPRPPRGSYGLWATLKLNAYLLKGRRVRQVGA